MILETELRLAVTPMDVHETSLQDLLDFHPQTKLISLFLKQKVVTKDNLEEIVEWLVFVSKEFFRVSVNHLLQHFMDLCSNPLHSDPLLKYKDEALGKSI
ncbi:hypothetical protein DPEC_G00087640 [Dallia pectoralis]|uniref:Uncharacterized protein n=1 Tax=Dallia pectoralis TaxID=75939 RepID=A0ACC2H0C3_DALPE|nr:hypothetical protein DPEC_G00087640 [Dallia pectoralis]